MKKTIITVLIALIIGSFFGYMLFRDINKNIDTVFDGYKEVTIFQAGVFTTKENAEKHASNIKSSTVVKDGDFYRVYIAILDSEDSINMMKTYFDQQKIKYYLKKDNIKQTDLIETISKYEQVLLKAEEKATYEVVNSKILEKYKELM